MRLEDQALQSLTIAIECLQRPHDRGRVATVLLLLQHALELLCKAAIYQASGTIHEPGAASPYHFRRCLAIARSELDLIDEASERMLGIVDDLRNCAAHNLLDLSEEALSWHTQRGVRVFEQVLQTAFAEHLNDHLPTRVLPSSTPPPGDLRVLVESEFRHLRRLLAPGKRRHAEARARLRHVFILEANVSGAGGQPAVSALERLMRLLKRGDGWQTMFPGLAGLQRSTAAQHPSSALRITRDPEAPPVRLVSAGEAEAEQATLVREVDLLERYPLGLRQVAEQLGLTTPRALALIRHEGLQTDPACFREVRVGAASYKRYSPQALVRLRSALAAADMAAVWLQHRPRARQ